MVVVGLGLLLSLLLLLVVVVVVVVVVGWVIDGVDNDDDDVIFFLIRFLSTARGYRLQVLGRLILFLTFTLLLGSPTINEYGPIILEPHCPTGNGNDGIDGCGCTRRSGPGNSIGMAPWDSG